MMEIQVLTLLYQDKMQNFQIQSVLKLRLELLILVNQQLTEQDTEHLTLLDLVNGQMLHTFQQQTDHKLHQSLCCTVLIRLISRLLFSNQLTIKEHQLLDITSTSMRVSMVLTSMKLPAMMVKALLSRLMLVIFTLASLCLLEASTELRQLQLINWIQAYIPKN